MITKDVRSYLGTDGEEVLAPGCVSPCSQPSSGSKVHKPRALLQDLLAVDSLTCVSDCSSGCPNLDSDHPGTSLGTFVSLSSL